MKHTFQILIISILFISRLHSEFIPATAVKPHINVIVEQIFCNSSYTKKKECLKSLYLSIKSEKGYDSAELDVLIKNQVIEYVTQDMKNLAQKHAESYEDLSNNEKNKILSAIELHIRDSIKKEVYNPNGHMSAFSRFEKENELQQIFKKFFDKTKSNNSQEATPKNNSDNKLLNKIKEKERNLLKRAKEREVKIIEEQNNAKQFESLRESFKKCVYANHQRRFGSPTFQYPCKKEFLEMLQHNKDYVFKNLGHLVGSLGRFELKHYPDVIYANNYLLETYTSDPNNPQIKTEICRFLIKESSRWNVYEHLYKTLDLAIQKFPHDLLKEADLAKNKRRYLFITHVLFKRYNKLSAREISEAYEVFFAKVAERFGPTFFAGQENNFLRAIYESFKK